MPQIKASIQSLDSKRKRELCNAYLDGEYELEYATDFWSKRDSTDCLAGERKLLGSGIMCATLRFSGSALLVSVEDSANQVWYAWIH